MEKIDAAQQTVDGLQRTLEIASRSSYVPTTAPTSAAVQKSALFPPVRQADFLDQSHTRITDC